MQPAPQLSIVTTVYKLAAYVSEFHRRATAAARQLTDSYEIIFVNDGSPDNAEDEIRKLAESDSHVVGVMLSRNFGQHPAIMAGLAHARGERVFLLDVDLEEQPEWLQDFSKTMDAGKWDVVYGVQETRKGGWFERVSGEFFWRLISWLSDMEIPANLCNARLMSREYARALADMPERNLFLGGLFTWVGFRQTPVTVCKTSRETASTYSLRRRVALAVNAITSFSNKPLKLIFYSGMLIAALAVLYGTAIVLNKLLYPGAITSGWASLMASVWFLGGTIITLIGGIGIYLSKIFIEVKQRPVAIVREILRSGQPATSA